MLVHCCSHVFLEQMHLLLQLTIELTIIKVTLTMIKVNGST